MADVIDIALLETLALPFAAALVVALAAWAAGAIWAGFAVALGVVAGEIAGQSLVAGVPALPPMGAIDKLPWLALGGAVVGLGAARLADAQRRRRLVLGALALAVLWIGWPRLMIPHAEAWLIAGLVWAGAAWALSRSDESPGAAGALVLVVAAFAAAGVGFYGSSYKMAQVIGVLAAATAGAMAGAGLAGPGLGAAGRLAVLGPLAGLVTILALYTNAAPFALVLLLPVFLAEPALHWLGAGREDSRLGRTPWRLAATTGLALLPAAAAVGVAMWHSGPLYF